jgi:hypothetical protein
MLLQNKNHGHKIKNDDYSIGWNQELWELAPGGSESPRGAHGERPCSENVAPK